MSYALFVYDTTHSLDGLTPVQRRAVHDEYVALADTPGLVGRRLQAPETAVTVTIGPDDGERDLVGFYVLDTDDAARALEIAERIPAARLGGAIRVQPLVAET